MPRPASDQPTDGELEILRVLWAGGPMALSAVCETMRVEREVAATTVATTPTSTPTTPTPTVPSTPTPVVSPTLGHVPEPMSVVLWSVVAGLGILRVRAVRSRHKAA